VRTDQATYHGLKKSKEAFHDADLYRLYHKVSDEIESRGGKLPEPARTVCAVAAFTGLTRSELRGLKWKIATAKP